MLGGASDMTVSFELSSLFTLLACYQLVAHPMGLDRFLLIVEMTSRDRLEE
jgi:hypothetical protein